VDAAAAQRFGCGGMDRVGDRSVFCGRRRPLQLSLISAVEAAMRASAAWIANSWPAGSAAERLFICISASTIL
jgi:hypothetical protein